MKKNQTAEQLHQLGRALYSRLEDTLTCDQCQTFLPDYIQAESERADGSGADGRFVAVRNHLLLCPHCTAAYAQVREWLTATLQDTIPNAAAYPAFDLAFLEPPALAGASLAWPFALIQKHRQQGEQWLQAAAGALYLLFAPAPTLAEAGWAVKSGAEETLLARTIIGEDEFPGWEIEATVFATAEDQCRVEVSLYAFAQSIHHRAAELAGIGVTLYDGVNEHAAVTDANGLVEFDAVPRARSANLIVRVDLPSADQSGSPINTKGAQ